MEGFWKKATEAADQAKGMAKLYSKKGMELAEATAEQASRKLKDLRLAESVGAAVAGAAGPAPPPPPPARAELDAYGITPAFEEFIRALNYATFRDFPEDQLPPRAGAGAGAPAGAAAAGEQGGAGAEGGGAAAAAPAPAPPAADPPPALNAWQARHAALVVAAVPQVNELRFVLCPRYMPDDRFWAVYFALARRHLPDAASFEWRAGDRLPCGVVVGEPARGGAGAGGGGAPAAEGAAALAGLGESLRALGDSLGARLQAGVAALPAGLLPGGAPAAAEGGAPAAPPGGGAAHAPPPPPPQGMLAADPDLEALLHGAGDGGAGDGGGSAGGGGEEEDLDLDKYLSELAAEEEGEEGGGGSEGGAAAGGGEADDGVDAALAALAADDEGAAAGGKDS